MQSRPQSRPCCQPGQFGTFSRRSHSLLGLKRFSAGPKGPAQGADRGPPSIILIVDFKIIVVSKGFPRCLSALVMFVPVIFANFPRRPMLLAQAGINSTSPLCSLQPVMLLISLCAFDGPSVNGCSVVFQDDVRYPCGDNDVCVRQASARNQIGQRRYRHKYRASSIPV